MQKQKTDNNLIRMVGGNKPVWNKYTATVSTGTILVAHSFIFKHFGPEGLTREHSAPSHVTFA